MRTLIILAASLALAGLAGHDAARASARSHPVLAKLFATEPMVRLRANEALLATPALARPGALQAHAKALERDARAALRAAPLEPVALRHLATTAALDDEASAETLLSLAGRTNRRNLTTELLLVEQAVGQGAIARALRHYDHALSVHPPARATLFPILASAINDPAILRAIEPFAARPWFAPFLAQALANGADDAPLLALVQQAGRHAPADRQEALLGGLIGQALARGSYGLARELASALPGAADGRLDRLGFDAQTSDARLAPLSWALTQSGVTTARLAPRGGLAIEIAPDQTELVAERVTLLPPGAYQVTHSRSYDPEAPRPLLAWSIACLAPDAPERALLTEMVDGEAGTSALAWPLAIPASCLAQRWRLTATAAEGSRPSVAIITSLSAKAR